MNEYSFLGSGGDLPVETPRVSKPYSKVELAQDQGWRVGEPTLIEARAARFWRRTVESRLSPLV